MDLTAHRLDAMIKWDKGVRDEYVEKVTQEEMASINYEEYRESLYHLLDHMHHHFPCDKCTAHYLEYKEQNPLPDKDDPSFFKWVWTFHNSVNERTGKRTFTIKEAEDHFYDTWMDVAENVRLSEAEVMRMEDHRKIKEMEERLAAYESGTKGAVNQALLISLVGVTIVSALIIAYLIFLR